MSDSYYERDGSTGDDVGDPALTGRSGGEWISLLDVDWDNGAIAWRPLCRHGSS